MVFGEVGSPIFDCSVPPVSVPVSRTFPTFSDFRFREERASCLNRASSLSAYCEAMPSWPRSSARIGFPYAAFPWRDGACCRLAVRLAASDDDWTSC